MDAFRQPTPPADEADRRFAEEHLLDCIRDFPDAYKQFNGKQYAAFYQTHRDAIAPVYEAMDRWVCAHPNRRQALLEDFTAEFLRQWEDYHRAHPKARSKHARDRLAFSHKLTLAWYTMPAVRSLGLSVSEAFPRLLCDRFKERYPDNCFELGSFEEINSGFRKHLSLFRLFQRHSSE